MSHPESPLKSFTTTTGQRHPAEPAATTDGRSAPKNAARKGALTAVRPDPRTGDGRHPVAWLHITAPGRGAIPTAHSWCACGHDRSAVGHRRVHALIDTHTAHRSICPLRQPTEGSPAA